MAEEYTPQSYDISKTDKGYFFLSPENKWEPLTKDMVGGELNDNVAKQFRDGMRQYQTQKNAAPAGTPITVQAPPADLVKPAAPAQARGPLDIASDIVSRAGEKIGGGISNIISAAGTSPDPNQGILDRMKQVGLGAVGGVTGGLYQPGGAPATEAQQAQRTLGSMVGGALPVGAGIKGLEALGFGARTAGVLGTTVAGAAPDILRGQPEEAASSALANLGLAGGTEAAKVLGSKLLMRGPAGKALTNQDVGQALTNEAKGMGPAFPSKSYYAALDSDTRPVVLANSQSLGHQIIIMAENDPLMADAARVIAKTLPRYGDSAPLNNVSEMNRTLNGAEYQLSKAGKGRQAELLRNFQAEVIKDLQRTDPQQAHNLEMATWSFKRELGSKALQDLVRGKPIVGRSGQPINVKDFEQSVQSLDNPQVRANLNRWLSPREVNQFRQLAIEAARVTPPTNLRGKMSGSPFREITPVAIPAWYMLRDTMPYANLMGILYLTAKVTDRTVNSVKFAQMAKNLLDNPRSYALSGAVGNAILQANQSGQSSGQPQQPGQ